MARKEQHSLYCQPDLWEQVRVVAELDERPMVWIVERAVKEYVAKKLAEHASRKDTENG
jgi:predicted transcriptional regulator